MPLAHAEESVAYCNSPLYAVNVYQTQASESAEDALKMRVFWREKAIIFADSPALRNQLYTQGFVYTSESGVSDDYMRSVWTLFIPEKEGQVCLLLRDGHAVEIGTVARRQPQ